MPAPQLPMQQRYDRISAISYRSFLNSFFISSASARSTAVISLFIMPIALLRSSSYKSFTALLAMTLASILSRPVGVPPLWIYPGTTERTSLPVRSSIISASCCTLISTPSAFIIMLCSFPDCCPRSTLRHTMFISVSISGTSITSSPPASPGASWLTVSASACWPDKEVNR